jgi:CYTH domain-containing protein
MTKKFPMSEKDSSEQEEHTIILSEKEFDSLARAGGKKVVKVRYYYDTPSGQKAEIDIFKDKLIGLALVDFEFNDKKKKDEFTMPDFCLADVGQDKWLAGGILSGKSYSDLEKAFKKYNYKKII